jgi:diguanylate cyclase (GGDEF)-like protein
VLLDGLMMLAVLCTFSWYFQVGPMLLHSNATLLASLVGACYPLGDLLVLFCLLVIATTSSLAHREYTGLLSIGLIFVVFADTVFSYGNVHGTYVNGITDVGWPTGYMIVAYVARQLLKKAESGEDEEIRNEAYPQAHVLTWRSLLPYACIPPLGALTYYSMLSRDEPDLSAGVFFGAELLVGFLLVRQLMALVDNQRLYDSLLQANEDLSARSSEVHEYASKMEALNHELKQTQLELLTNNIALAQVNGQLEELATRDGMTGLANHRAFQARLRDDVESASKASTPIALMLLDVDRFKDYNDSFGHPAGDEVLRTLGQLIGTSARKTDIVARYGGEEFVMLLPNVTEDEARVIAERVRVVIEGHMFHLRAVTVSAGVAYHRGGNIEADQLIEIADSALYKAKRGGRNRVVFEVIGDSSAQ